jgi:hypothetical protein
MAPCTTPSGKAPPRLADRGTLNIVGGAASKTLGGLIIHSASGFCRRHIYGHDRIGTVFWYQNTAVYFTSQQLQLQLQSVLGTWDRYNSAAVRSAIPAQDLAPGFHDPFASLPPLIPAATESSYGGVITAVQRKRKETKCHAAKGIWRDDKIKKCWYRGWLMNTNPSLGREI